MNAPRVLVAALDPSRNASRIPGMLRRAGCRVVAMTASDTSLAASSAIERVVVVDRRDPAAAVAVLRAEAALGYDLVLIADEALLQALARCVEPWTSAVLPVSPAMCAVVLDKRRMLDAVEAAGITIPSSRTVAGSDVAAAASQIGYPVVLKGPIGCGGSGVRRVDAEHELAAALASLGVAGAVTVQRFLPGAVGCTDVLFERGVPRCWTSALMHQPWPTPYHPATIRRPIAEPRVRPILETIGTITTFHGLAGLDWIVDEDGSLAFLEFNPRLTHVIGPARAAFGAEVRRMLAGYPATPHEVVLKRRPIPVFPAHFVRALKLRDVAQLAAWLPLRASSADLDWSDPGVLRSELADIAGGAMRRLAQRRRHRSMMALTAES